MKKVKLNYACVGVNFNKEQNLIYDVLKENGYAVEISDDPDFLVCDVTTENSLEFCGKPQVRIQHSGENFIPDFNLVDYAISPYPIQFSDRHFHLPACVWPRSHWLELSKKDRNYSPDFVREKDLFANFITSHESEYNIRGDFFKALCNYKRVDSPGTYLNNMPNGEVVDWKTDSKTNFQRRCKFTLCFESTLHHGFVTEKLMDAFYADTIPIYYGSTTAAEIFNKDAFINAADYDSFEEVIEKIIELDQDDEKYLQMLRQPILVDTDYPARLEEELCQFILHIFDQPPQDAYRRSRLCSPKSYDDLLSRVVDSELLTAKELVRRLIRKVTAKLTGK